MKIIKNFLNNLLDLIVSIYFNFYYFEFKDAMKFPLLVSHHIHIENMGKRGCLQVDNIKRAGIKLGRNGSFALGSGDKFYWNLSNKGIIRFEGTAILGRGTQVICGDEAKIIFGDNFYCNSQCVLNSSCKLIFGRDALIGWKSEFLTSDGHEVYELDNENKERRKSEIIIGKHCWIAANVTVLKEANVKDNSIIATKAFVSKQYEEGNVLIGGINKILKKDVNWKI